MLEPLALQLFSVPGAILPFYSRGSQTPTDSTKNPTGGPSGEGNGRRKENREQSYPSFMQECPTLVHVGIQVGRPKHALHAGGQRTIWGLADCAVTFPAWEVKSS